MKKGLLILPLVCLVLLCGCVGLCEWEIKTELENGLAVLSPTDSAYKDWYCTADLSTEEILSVNLKFGSELGEAGKTVCKIGEKTVEIDKTFSETADGTVIFFTLDNKYFKADATDKIRITQTFEKGEKEIYFSAKRIFEAIKEDQG